MASIPIWIGLTPISTPEIVEANKKPSEPGPNPTQTATPETDGTT